MKKSFRKDVNQDRRIWLVTSITISIVFVGLMFGFLSSPKPALSTATVDIKSGSREAVGRHQAIVETSDDPSSEFIAATDLVDSGRIEEARRKFLTILDEYPFHIDSLLELSLIELLDRNNPAAAIPYLQRTLEIDPLNDELLGEVAEIYLSSGRLSEGLKFFSDLNRMQNPTPIVSLWLAQLELRSERYLESMSALTGALRDPETKLRAQSIQVRVLLGQGKYLRALTMYERVSEELLDEVRACIKQNLTCEGLNSWLEMMQFAVVEMLIKEKNYLLAEDILYDLSARIPSDPDVIRLLNVSKKQQRGSLDVGIQKDDKKKELLY
ncbi:MAG: tetratricopeptide repeat protein [Pseudobacteriovorax sp.]|nr:tetratricopeptide repeat protein [Pseudobacteriovorax sp.]